MPWLSHRLIAGAVRTGEIQCLSPAFDPADAAAGGDLDDAIAALRHAGARMIVAEFPDTRDFQAFATLLASRAFTDEARVPDYFADGVALRIAMLRLISANTHPSNP
jgi:hypothetical protein